MKTIAYSAIDNIMISYFPDLHPTNEEYEESIQFMNSLGKKYGSFVAITFTDGGGPNSKQRKYSMAVLGKDMMNKSKAAVMSDKKIVRGIVSAFNWAIGDRIKAFRPDDIDNVLQWTGINIEYKQRILNEYTRLKADVENANSFR